MPKTPKTPPNTPISPPSSPFVPDAGAAAGEKSLEAQMIAQAQAQAEAKLLQRLRREAKERYDELCQDQKRIRAIRDEIKPIIPGSILQRGIPSNLSE